MIKRTSGLLLGLALMLLLATPGLAASPPSISELTAGPPPGAWQVYDANTGPRTAADIYGSAASGVNGFADAYRRTWTRPDQVIVDRVERFTSVIWASVRYTESMNAAAKNTGHTSYQGLPGFTPMAYETTDAPDAEGFLADSIVFSKGDYVAVVELAAKQSVPREVLMDQARRQLDLLPVATAEYSSIGAGVLIGGGVVVLVVSAVIVTAIVLATRRHAPVAAGVHAAGSPFAPVTGAQLSPDRRFWWNGQAWQDTESSIPAGSPRTPDARYWWDGARWRPAPPGA